MGDKALNFFRLLATIRKKHNYIQKFLDDDGIWSDDQNLFLQVFTREFFKNFGRDPNTNIQIAIVSLGTFQKTILYS